MYKRTVIQLLALKLSGEAKQEDLAELDQLILENPDSVYHDEVLKQLFHDKGDNSDIELYYDRHRLKFKDKLSFAEESVSTSKKFYTSKSLVAVCSLLVVLSIGLFFIYNYKKQESGANYNNSIASGSTACKNFILPDGTKVTLNSNSQLLYNKNMIKDGVRTVKLIGEAFFDVTHIENRPFVINTNKISIKVLGTAFNVKSYPEDVKTEATLLRGSIELSVTNRKVAKIILKPSQKFELTDNCTNNITPSSSMPSTGIRMVVEKINPIEVSGKEYSKEVSWIEKKLVFKNQSFEQMRPELERWFKIKLKIENKEINAYHFSGVFTDENLRQALSSMQLIKPFHFKINQHDVTIY
jgi:transmembrane sensor